MPLPAMSVLTDFDNRWAVTLAVEVKTNMTQVHAVTSTIDGEIGINDLRQCRRSSR
jgi:hypothetical protein